MPGLLAQESKKIKRPQYNPQGIEKKQLRTEKILTLLENGEQKSADVMMTLKPNTCDDVRHWIHASQSD